MPSRRQERVAKRVVQELVEALRNLKHVNLGFITLTRCEVSPDLHHAIVYYSVWGGDEEKDRCAALLSTNARVLRRMIGRPLGLKIIPDLHFEFDSTLETADRINRLIRDARKTDANPNPLTPEEAEALAAQAAGRRGAPAEARDEDPFESARRDVEEELFDEDMAGEEPEDPDWRPIDLDELPDDGDDDADPPERERNE